MDTPAAPPWLDAGELSTWLRFVGVLITVPAELDSQMQRDAGITHFEYVVMARLSEAPGHTLRISALAGMAHGSLSRLSHLIKRLERRGWIRREPCQSDGRFTNAVLTGAGLAKVVASAPGHARVVRHLVIDALTPTQLRQLDDISTRILDRVHDDGAAPPCS